MGPRHTLTLMLVTACGGRSSLGVLVMGDAGPAADAAPHPAGDAGEQRDAEPEPVEAGDEPTVDAAPLGAVQVSSGQGHTCALLSSGAVKCWGSNEYGGLGDGTKTDRYSPVSVVSLGGPATAVVAGAFFTCALMASGTVECWGDDGAGELGDGAGDTRSKPGPVLSLSTVTSLSSGGTEDTCAVLSSGGVRCWGIDMDGELGDGTPSAYQGTPVDVIGLGGSATAATPGGCAVLASGGIRCWGRNNEGELGDGTTITSYSPVDVVSLGGSGTLVSGVYGARCALLSSGTIRCWGANAHGQLGDGTTQTRYTPVTALLKGSAISVSTSDHTCAVLSSGEVDCWGHNFNGQLGDGTTVDRYVPVSVSLGGAATGVSTGQAHTCAVLASGGVRCWGANDHGQLGDGSTTSSSAPVTVVGFP